MLSYQHIYHAGNLADVQKHAVLCTILNYLTQKDKPLTYIETHAGRGLYDLGSAPSLKTREAEKGIQVMEPLFPPAHPYRLALNKVRALYGPMAYAGSPLFAALGLRAQDHLHLAELHPQEHHALYLAMADYKADLYHQDGLQTALTITPPMPRRGVMLIDPSFEVKDEYDQIPLFIKAIHRKWNVGLIMLWYPILTSQIHADMLQQLEDNHPDHLRHEVMFPPAKENHRMIGSGLFMINPPWNMAEECTKISKLFNKLS